MRILLSLIASTIIFACSQEAQQQVATSAPISTISPAGAPSPSSAPKKESKSSVAFIKGKVSVKRESQTLVINIGDKVYENDTITTGADSQCELDLEGIGTISISQNTSFLIKTIVSDGKKVLAQTEVLRGNVRAKVHKLAKGEQFLVGSKSAIAGVRGTEFSLAVAEGDKTTVAVNEGSVAILPPSTDLALLDSAEIFDQIADSAPHVKKGSQTTILVDDLKSLQDQLDEIQRLIDQTKADQEALKSQIDKYEERQKATKIDTKPLTKDSKKFFDEAQAGASPSPDSKTNLPQVLRVTFGKNIVDSGVQVVKSTGEGKISLVSVNGSDYWQADGVNTTGRNLASYVYFVLSNPDWRAGGAPKVRIELDYYDDVNAEATDSWVKLEYDSQGKHLSSGMLANFEMHGFTGYVGKSQSIKTLAWELDDAKFSGGTNVNDFRLIIPANFKLTMKELRLIRL